MAWDMEIWWRRVFNQSIHTIDLLQWIMGPVRRVHGHIVVRTHSIKTEDLGVATLRIFGNSHAFTGVVRSKLKLYLSCFFLFLWPYVSLDNFFVYFYRWYKIPSAPNAFSIPIYLFHESKPPTYRDLLVFFLMASTTLHMVCFGGIIINRGPWIILYL